MARKLSRRGYDVFLDAFELGPLVRVGTLFPHATRSDVPAAFEYAPDWLGDEDRTFMLDPRLELWRGEQYPPQGAAAFGIFMDAAPDRWGRLLMERREALHSRQQHRPMRALGELDFLLGVHDLTRSGALRFKPSDGGPYLDDSAHAAPPITSLPELASIVRRIEEPGAESLPEYDRWLAMLVAPGTSLGGARPKASFTDEQRLWIAKFPARDDRYDVGAWEYVTHQLALAAGIDVPRARLERLGEHGTFCVERFDREGGRRRMFASATTLLDRTDSMAASYLDLAEVITTHGAVSSIDTDLEQLFRRVVFNILVANRDDHLRNHGFLRLPTGWHLAPAYDINPNPYRLDHVLTIDGKSAAPNLNLALETCELYRLSRKAARDIVERVRAAVSTWDVEARRAGLSSTECARMRPLFAPA